MTGSSDAGTEIETRRWEWLAFARFLLAAIVVVFHLVRRLGVNHPVLVEIDGRVAVIAFLLISGYSISASLAQRVAGFYRRRLLRVYPLLIGALVFTEILTRLSYKAYPSAGLPILIGNLVAPPGHLAPVPTLDLPLWSLGCEIVFYALAPFLVRAPSWVLGLLALASARAYVSPLVNEWLYGAPTLCFFWVWLLGFMLHSRRTPAVVLATAAASALLWNHPLIRYSKISIGIQYLGTLALLVTPWLPRPRGPLDYLGAISFHLYLVHFPVIIFLYDSLKVTDVSRMFVAVTLVTLVFHHLVDAPGRRLLGALFPPAERGG